MKTFSGKSFIIRLILILSDFFEVGNISLSTNWLKIQQNWCYYKFQHCFSTSLLRHLLFKNIIPGTKERHTLPPGKKRITGKNMLLQAMIKRPEYGSFKLFSIILHRFYIFIKLWDHKISDTKADMIKLKSISCIMLGTEYRTFYKLVLRFIVLSIRFRNLETVF